jgi:hypothetical protein
MLCFLCGLSDGGGVYGEARLFSLMHTKLLMNAADRAGGGVFCASASAMTLSNCSIKGNNASTGGGVYWLYSAGSGPELRCSSCALGINLPQDWATDPRVWLNNIPMLVV